MFKREFDIINLASIIIKKVKIIILISILGVISGFYLYSIQNDTYSISLSIVCSGYFLDNISGKPVPLIDTELAYSFISRFYKDKLSNTKVLNSSRSSYYPINVSFTSTDVEEIRKLSEDLVDYINSLEIIDEGFIKINKSRITYLGGDTNNFQMLYPPVVTSHKTDLLVFLVFGLLIPNFLFIAFYAIFLINDEKRLSIGH